VSVKQTCTPPQTVV